MSEKKIIIAIDGHSSCGKSTMAKQLAQQLGYIYIDTGAMYRVVTLVALRNGWITGKVPDKAKVIEGLKDIHISFKWDEKLGKNTTFLNGENVEDEIRQLEVSENVSPISTIAEVREEMVKQQRENGKSKGIVMDGRDIGTVIAPDADVKLWVDADVEQRGYRRWRELLGFGEEVSLEQVIQQLRERDQRDQNRKDAPAAMAADAVLIDTTDLTIEAAVEKALAAVEAVLARGNRT
jgi:cytidylate kinase